MNFVLSVVLVDANGRHIGKGEIPCTDWKDANEISKRLDPGNDPFPKRKCTVCIADYVMGKRMVIPVDVVHYLANELRDCAP